MKFLNVALIVFLLVAVCHSEESGIYDPQPLTAAEEEYIFKISGLTPLNEGEALQPLQEIVTPVSDIQWKRFWAGSSAETETGATIQVGLKSVDSSLKPFSIWFNFEHGATTIRLSAPYSPQFAGGYRMSSDKNKKKILFLEGSERRSVVAIVPPFINGQIQSITVCPRHFDVDASPYDVPTLRNTQYVGESIQFEPQGWVKGKFSTVGFIGFARAVIEIGALGSVSVPFEDVTRMENPSVSLGYSPAIKPAPQPFDLSKNESFKTGIRASLLMETPAGHTRKRVQETSLFVKQIMNTGPTSVAIGGIAHPIDPGTCFVVSKRDRISEEYTGPKPDSQIDQARDKN